MNMRLFCQDNPSHERVSIRSPVELWNDGSVLNIREPGKATCVQCGGVVKASLPPGWVMQESRILDDEGDTDHIVQLFFFAPETFISKSLIAIAADALRDIIATLEGDEKEAIGYCTDEDKPGFGIFMGIDNSDLDFLWKALRERLSILAISFLGYEWYDSSGYEENGPWPYINSGDPLSTT
jgi:hypothetical protein